MLAALLGQQIDLRDEVAAGLGFLAAAGVANGFARFVNPKAIILSFRNIQQVRAVISRWDFLTKMSFVETLLL